MPLVNNTGNPMMVGVSVGLSSCQSTTYRKWRTLPLNHETFSGAHVKRSVMLAYSGASGKEPACQCTRHRRPGFSPWAEKIPWRRSWQSTPVFLPGESHGQRSLVGYSPWGCKGLDKTEITLHAHTQCKINDLLGFRFIFFEKIQAMYLLE